MYRVELSRQAEKDLERVFRSDKRLYQRFVAALLAIARDPISEGKPLHGELKLPGMASDFYRRQIGQHLEIGIRAMEKLGAMAPERLHSRKLRSFAETAFQ